MDGWLFEAFINSQREKDKEYFTDGLLTEHELQTRTNLLDEMSENFNDTFYKIHILGDIDE